MAIMIPPAHVAALRMLATMDPAKRRQLVAAIQGCHAPIEPNDLVVKVEEATKLDERSAELVVSMLISMYRASRRSAGEFGREVVQAAKQFVEQDAAVIDWGSFKTDVDALLGSDESLGFTAKVMGVRREYGKVFCTGRILTDLRPIFGEDPTKAPLAGAIVHTLRITYHEDDKHRDFHVALDSADLDELRDLLERAKKKESSLRAEAAKTSMRLLDTEVA